MSVYSLTNVLAIEEYFFSTFANAYSQLIASLDNSSQDHQNLSESLNSLIVEASKVFEKRHEDMKKKVRLLFSQNTALC